MLAVLVAVCTAVLIVLALAFARKTRPTAHVACRPGAGLFSNLVECIQTTLCHPALDVECTGWPREIAALVPHMPHAERAADARVDSLYDCYLMQEPRVFESDGFAEVRWRMHRLVVPNAPFAPAPFLLERARAWWDRNVGPCGTFARSARFVVGVHGRAALHYESATGLAEHTRALCAAAEREMPPGAHLLFTSCNATMVAAMAARYGERVKWRRPEGALSQNNEDWGTVIDAETSAGALVDALLLSMCDVVVCGSSNVILYVAALNPTARIVLAPHLRAVRGK